MFKAPADKIAVIDIETVPDIETIRRVYGLPESNYTDAAALEIVYQKHGASPENPAPFLKAMFHKVVSVSVLYRTSQIVDNGRGRKITLKFHTLPKINGVVEQLSEADIVRRTLSFIGRNKAQVAGWNSFGFDQPALFQRAVILGVPIPAYCERPNKPWEGNDYFAKFSDANVDLMLCLAGEGGGAKSKLGEFAAACGIPGKMGMDGSQVAEAYMRGETPQIVAYNEFDTASAFLIWLRMAWIGGHLGGFLAKDEAERIALNNAAYLEEQELFKALLRSRIDEGAKHFSQYLAAWTGEEYRAKAEPGAGLKQWTCGAALALKVIEATARLESTGVTPDQWREELRNTFWETSGTSRSRKELTPEQAEQWAGLLIQWAELNEKKAAKAA